MKSPSVLYPSRNTHKALFTRYAYRCWGIHWMECASIDAVLEKLTMWEGSDDNCVLERWIMLSIINCRWSIILNGLNVLVFVVTNYKKFSDNVLKIRTWWKQQERWRTMIFNYMLFLSGHSGVIGMIFLNSLKPKIIYRHTCLIHSLLKNPKYFGKWYMCIRQMTKVANCINDI